MSYKSLIQRNAPEIVRLYNRIKETVEYRDMGPVERNQWSDACAEFHTQYQSLAFVGGVSTARERLRRGETDAIEYALDFLEVRPYFHRSGYMYKDFMRVLRNCPMSASQRTRYSRIRERYQQYRETRRQPHAE
jgi:hypothetical protein